MSLELLAMKAAAAGSAAPAASPATPQAPGSDGADFRTALARAATPSAPVQPAALAQPLREVPDAAPGSRPRGSLGHQILDSLENLYRSDQGLKRTSGAASGPAATHAVLAPGSTGAAPMRTGPIAESGRGRGTPAPAVDFETMLKNLEQLYAHAIQVSVATKTTGSFTSSLNKLMSSA